MLILLPFFVNVIGFSSTLSADPIYTAAMVSPNTRVTLMRGAPGWVDPNAGTSTQSLGGTAASRWLSGEFPWWDHDAGPGLPLASSMHSHALFLPFVLLLALGNGPLWLKIAMEAIAGCAMYALARKLKLRLPAALAAALAFEFCGTFAWLSDAPIMPIPFLPMFVLGIEHAVGPESGWRGRLWLMIAPAIAFSLYGGFPETAYIDGLLALLWALIRLGQLPAPERPGAALRIGGAGVIGVLLTGPLLTTFGVLLETTSSLGDREVITSQALNAESFVQMFFAYFSGPLGDASISNYLPQFQYMWVNLAGFIGLPILFLAVLGCSGPRLRALRIGLAAWIAISLLMCFQTFPRFNPFTYFPFMTYVAFFRYSWPSLEFSAILLAALAIDDLHRGQKISGLGRWAPPLVALATIIVCLILIRGDLTSLLSTMISRRFFFASATVFCGATVLVSLLFYATALSRSVRSSAIALVIIGVSLATYFMPLLSGVTGPGPDLEAIRFLRENIGLNRFYSLGPIQPNYASFYRIPSLNANYDPVPDLWTAYVRDRLDPGADASSFNGVWPPKHDEIPFDSRAEQMTRHLGEFEKIGVKYILATDNPFIPQPGTQTVAPTFLANVATGKPFEDTVDLAPRDGNVVGFSIYLGTYNGAANGDLEVRLCREDVCSTTSADLRRAVNNGFLAIELSQPLKVSARAPLALTVRQVGGTFPVAIMRYDSRAANSNFVLTAKGAAVRFEYDTDAFPKRVYASAAMSIYELPNPSPYSAFVDGACRQVAHSQDAFDLNCETASRFMRREMLFPGWTASIDGVEAPIELYDKLFQLVAVPAGAHRLTFAYAPPFIREGTAALALGLLALAGLAFRRLPTRG